ncbi:SusC/RagA family TonB-linked outer membrane protein [Salegentibacter salarius]|uniref:SusC/RagA family TonB-linked outer membrane protein n=1 Tax=Salegentibacter salarius TaxID=435906 RepID=A0A2N0U4U2_9FLAO|nr:TonB-dependent receptor [Salegentibacter salarius]OEY71341.1 SusC/RagA family protein [Salegentibacter salarius]PKD22023.1 SusC/RagA family TonB-linked outer membrane protein [Salegentibacter salarius]SLJ92625.1 TonB-linked outer membrane protein, SusC/RagA family [Salegentibacter salarius]
MNRILVLILFCIGTFSLQAQNFSVSGTVDEADTGLPLPGVNIILKNTTNGVVTDFDGNYTINNITAGDVLVFSYVGFLPQEITVGENQTEINVILKTDSAALDEVVVIGYGTQQKKDITGAVSVVSNKTIEQLNPIKVEQALQGTAAGVNVTPSSGAPGAGININIRGIASNSENGPLVLIDGYQGDLNTINPNDIESISILKDAQAAIYGIAGANGVVLVSTKSGKKNTAPTIQYDAYVGVQETSRELPLLNATEYGLLLNESYANNGQALPFPNVSELGRGTDFQEEVFDTSPIMSHNLTLNGGSEKVTYSFGVSHLDQEGVIGAKKSDFQRSTARFNIGVDISDAFTFTGNTIYTSIDRRSINENGLGSVLFNALNIPPTFGVDQEDVDGTLGNEIINPLSQIENTFNDYNLNKFNGSFSLDYMPIDELTFTSRIGYSLSTSKGKDFAPIIDYGPGKVFNNVRSTVNQNRINDNSYTYDLFGTYENTFDETHHLTGTAGMTVIRNWGDGLYATGYDVPNNSWDFADISLTTGTNDGLNNSAYKYDIRKLSFFGRLQYDYKGKYLFSGMLRRDASTRFGPENRVGYFPSATAGWILSEEYFLSDSNVISFLKLRGSFGILGNDEAGGAEFYRSLLNGEATYVLDGNLVNGTALGRIANPASGWEEAEKTNIGIDLRLLNNRIDISADVFREDRKDLLVAGIPVSGIFGGGAPGSGAPTINAGTTRNEGLEFAINYKENFGDDIRVGVGYNATFLRNEVTEVNGTEFLPGGQFGVGQPQPARFQEGFPIGYFYGYETDGIFQNQAEVDAHPSQETLGAAASPGDIRYVDTNGDGVINVDDRTNIGDPIPTATMGLNLNFSYKNFDFTAYTYASLGNDMVRNYERNQPNVNRHAYYLERWTGPGTSNEVPRVTTGATSNVAFSDFYVEDASYARIQNVQIGYSLPETFLEKTGINRLRIYTSVQNLYTFTNYKGFDPSASTGEAIGGGIDYGFYPVPRIFLAGLNLNF